MGFAFSAILSASTEGTNPKTSFDGAVPVVSPDLPHPERTVARAQTAAPTRARRDNERDSCFKADVQGGTDMAAKLSSNARRRQHFERHRRRMLFRPGSR